MNKNLARILKLIALCGYILLMFLAWYYVSVHLFDQDKIRAFFSNFGFFSAIMFVIIQILYVIIVPIYNTPIHLAGGYIFGPYLGFFLNYVATTIGLFIIVFLSRRYGRKIISSLVSKKTIEKYDKLISSNRLTPYFLFVMYVLPFFPDDEITYIIALSDLKFRNYIPAILLGNIPKAAVSFLGSNAVAGIFPTIIVRVIVLLIGTVYFFRKNIADLFR